MWTLRAAVESDDPPWDNVGAAMWSVIELNSAIICASLPTLRPFFAKVVPGMFSSNGSNATYERYGSTPRYATKSSSRLRSRNAMQDKINGPEGTSTEELALNDVDPRVLGKTPAVYVESSGEHKYDIGHEHLRRIVITRETMVKKQ